MSKRVCSVPGCPTISDHNKCMTHRQQAEQARGNRQQRGYDKAHDAERTKWQAIIDRTGYPCTSPTCTHPADRITRGQPWDLGHTDDRTIYHGPEHPDCNRRAAGKKAHRYQ